MNLQIFLGTVVEFPFSKEEAIWDYFALYLKQDGETIDFVHHFSSSSQFNCFKGLLSLFFFLFLSVLGIYWVVQTWMDLYSNWMRTEGRGLSLAWMIVQMCLWVHGLTGIVDFLCCRYISSIGSGFCGSVFVVMQFILPYIFRDVLEFIGMLQFRY